MTTLRTAAQQALEALEGKRYTACGWRSDCDKAITALRAALAEPPDSTKPAVEPIGWLEAPHGEFRFNTRLKHEFPPQSLNWRIPLYALAEPYVPKISCGNMEPVAKVDLMTTGGNAGLATRIVEIDDHLRERLRPGQLLYTTPPQRHLPDWISYDKTTDVLSIHGKKYAAAIFGEEGFLSPTGTVLRVEQSQPETVTLTVVPQRKPLTEEEIRQIALDTPIGGTNFARAIERAHGIT